MTVRAFAGLERCGEAALDGKRGPERLDDLCLVVPRKVKR